MAVDPIIECFSTDLVPEYCYGLDSSAVYTVHPSFAESLPGHYNRGLPCLPLHMHAEEIVPAFLKSNIYIGLCLLKAPTLTRLRSYEMFELSLSIRIDKSVGLRGILDIPLLTDAFPYRLAGGIPLKEGVL